MTILRKRTPEWSLQNIQFTRKLKTLFIKFKNIVVYFKIIIIIIIIIIITVIIIIINY